MTEIVVQLLPLAIVLVAGLLGWFGGRMLLLIDVIRSIEDGASKLDRQGHIEAGIGAYAIATVIQRRFPRWLYRLMTPPEQRCVDTVKNGAVVYLFGEDPQEGQEN